MQHSTLTKKHIFSFLTILFIGLFIIAPDLEAQKKDPLIEKVDKIFEKWDKSNSPGCALGIIKDGKFIYRKGYGMANLEHDIPIDSQSVFRIGSTSKQFTAMCIALLEEEEKLSVADSIRKHIPEMPAYADNITIRHLLHHTSGIRDYLTLWALAGFREDDFFTDPEVVEMLARQKELNFQSGDEHLYSNSGYFLLSVIVKNITGKSMRVYAQEKIFKPLNMQNTHFHDDHSLAVKNRAAGYAPRGKDKYKISMTTLGMIGDGGIFTCVDDLLLWDQNFYNNKLGKGSPDLIRKMLTTGKLNNSQELEYAFGLEVNEYKGLKLVSHGGAFVGFRADMIRFPEQKFSVICLANLSTINPSQLARKVADVYLAVQLKKEPGKIPAKPKFIELSPDKLKPFTGAFRNPKTKTLWRISLKKKRLLVKSPHSQFGLKPVSEAFFYAVNAPINLSVEFQIQQEGERPQAKVIVEGGEPSFFQPITLVKLTSDELTEYTGRYYSDELDVAYDILVKKNKLFIRHENPHKDYPKKAFLLIVKDEFQLEGRDIIFQRDSAGKIIAYTVNAGRVKNIKFIKQD